MRVKNDNHLFDRLPIATFCVITFLMSMILGAGYQFTNSPFISPQYAPAIALVIISTTIRDWSVWQEMIQNTFNRRINPLWLIVAVLLPIAIILISSLTMTLFGSKFIPWQVSKSGFVIVIVTVILGCIFEEIGWRGYLLPKFAEKQSMFTSSIGVGIIWGVWHFKFAYGIVGFILFVMVMICFSIIMGWIYIATKGNLFGMILFHFGINIGTVTLLQNKEGVLFYSLTILVCVLICIPIVLKNRKEFFNQAFLKLTDSKSIQGHQDLI